MNILVILFTVLVVYFFMRMIPVMLSARVKKMYKKQTSEKKVTKKKPKQKIIGKHAGEYVDFEEIED